MRGEPENPHSSPMLLRDEVAIGKRQEDVLLHSLAEADAEQSAGADRDQRLVQLIVHRVGAVTRVEERR